MTDDMRDVRTRGRNTWGPNEWLVAEMYEQFQADANSVSPSWQEFFADNFRPEGEGKAPLRPEVRSQTPSSSPDEASDSGEQAGGSSEEEFIPLRGVAARIAENMQASLAIPTATSVRSIPSRLLEVNREIMNNHLARMRRGRISYTHLIAFAILEALREVPNMANAFVEREGKPFVRRSRSIGLGLAVDIARKDGTRSLMVPCIRNADTLDFLGFWQAYDEIVRKVKTNKLTPDDFVGVSVTVTNPGTLGTEHSVPRLMNGQGLIVGVGAIGFPAEYEASDPRSLAQIGVSKTFTITSTYDHRIIQGAESGLFLGRVHDLLIGKDGFYDQVFRALEIPYLPARWTRDISPVDDPKVRLEKHLKVWRLINMYRVRGHLIADLDPLRAQPPHIHPELDPVSYDLSLWDNDREYYTGGFAGKERDTFGNILSALRDAYCRQTGIEYMFIQNPEERAWIQSRVEGVSVETTEEDQRWILSQLNAAEAFERFLHAKYVGQKRFGLEGAESAIPIIETILDEAAAVGIGDAYVGMAHRGRLNVLINVVGKSYRELFTEFEGTLDPAMAQGSGDVKYHKGFHARRTTKSGHTIDLRLASNPSHLEAVDPVVEGMVRARQDQLDWTNDPSDSSVSFPVLPLLIHGDAAFAGQGVVAETLNLSLLPGYRTGGTVHLVIDNQVGFTTSPESARSSIYATDVAKMVQAPVFHVNGDDPEACVRVAKLAFAYRQRFAKDAVVHMVCYRRFGHNEADEPSYTQPQMYARIQSQRSVRKIYTEHLLSRGDLNLQDAEAALEEFGQKLQQALDETRSSAPPKATVLPPARTVRPELRVDTGVDDALLDRVAHAVHTVPEGFALHPKLRRLLENRATAYAEGDVDWALGEALAFGTLLLDGVDVRLAGQDTRRGTFSHRHSVLVDHDTGEEFCPLMVMAAQEKVETERKLGRFFVYDSLLSEYAALGFEYGYSLVSPDALVVWEAQFGDFANGAQIVIDQFLSSSRDKWDEASNLVLMLPHGYEGQGPEHSSARLERFLALAANDNLRIVTPTTSAQHFHVLRRQVLAGERIPLVMMSPKSLLRSRHAHSHRDEFSRGNFHTVLDDPAVDRGQIDPKAVDRLIFCTGKIAYEAMEKRDQLGVNVPIIRLEQLYPWPHESLERVYRWYENATEIVWLQEEPRNMGAARFVERFLERQPQNYAVKVVSRVASGSPATGTFALHQLETEDLLARAFS